MDHVLLASPRACEHAYRNGPVRSLRSVGVISSREQHHGRVTSVCCVAVTRTHPGPQWLMVNTGCIPLLPNGSAISFYVSKEAWLELQTWTVQASAECLPLLDHCAIERVESLPDQKGEKSTPEPRCRVTVSSSESKHRRGRSADHPFLSTMSVIQHRHVVHGGQWPTLAGMHDYCREVPVWPASWNPS